MKLLVGLGNPGREYAWTRHNAGYWILDILADRWGARFSNKGSGEIATTRLEGESTILLKPRTYMNRSGDAVIEVCSFYKIEPADIVAIHDDVDLAPGRIKLKTGGGTGGHKGLQSMENRLGSRDFVRVRFGVGRPDHPAVDTADFVLARIPDAERGAWMESARSAADATICLLKDGMGAAQNRFHGEDAVKTEKI